MNKILSAMAIAALCISTAHALPASRSSDASAVDTACASDAATAGCSGEVVGHGLLKCMHAYKKAHSTYTVSAGCKAALDQMKSDKKSSGWPKPPSPPSGSAPSVSPPSQPAPELQMYR